MGAAYEKRSGYADPYGVAMGFAREGQKGLINFCELMVARADKEMEA